MPDQMAPDVEKRIRALPGNTVCCDCSNLNPQWASVNYGALMCLDCSGHHRSLGVHLSFVRSIQMDSWSDRQIRAMETSGGNAVLVEFFKARGIEKNMRIPTKYNTKQAAYYRERLTRRLDGKTEPPPDPGRYDPVTGASEAQGAEPLPGETTDQYNARQAKLREEARERIRQKFGGMQSMGGVGSQANVAGGGFGSGGGGDEGGGLGGVLGGALGVVGGVAGGAFGFFKEKVLENDDLRGTLRNSVSSIGSLTASAIDSVKQTVQDGDVIEALKRNATFQEGSAIRGVAGWTANTVSSVASRGGQAAGQAASGMGSGFGDFFGDGDDGGGAPKAPRCDQGHALRSEPRSTSKCSLCQARGTRYACSRGCEYDICIKCFEKPPAFSPASRVSGSNSGKKDNFSFDDDEWGQASPPPADITKDDMDKLAKEMGMKLSAAEPVRKMSASPQPGPPPALQTSKSAPPAVSAGSPAAAPEVKKDKGLAPVDDFFGEFGM